MTPTVRRYINAALYTATAMLLLVTFPARAQAPVLAGDVVRVEAVADPGVAVVAPHATTPLVAADHLMRAPEMVPPGAANLSMPVCTPPASQAPRWYVITSTVLTAVLATLATIEPFVVQR